MAFDKHSKLNDILNEFQNLSGVNQKDELKQVLISKGLTIEDSDTMVDMIIKANAILISKGNAQPEDVLQGKTFSNDNNNNLIGAATFNSIANNIFNVIWHKPLNNILLVDNDNNYIASKTKYDSDGNILCTGTTGYSWNCADDDNNLYCLLCTTSATDKTLDFIKADTNFQIIINKSIDISSALNYNIGAIPGATNKKFNGAVYVDGYIYCFISTTLDNAYNQGKTFVCKFSLNGDLLNYAYNGNGNYPLSLVNLTVTSDNNIYTYAYGNDAPNPSDSLFKYNIENNTLTSVGVFSNSDNHLIRRNNSNKKNDKLVMWSLPNGTNSTPTLRIYDLNFNLLASLDSLHFNITNYGNATIDDNDNIIQGPRIFNINSLNYYTFTNKMITTTTPIIIDKENNIIAQCNSEIYKFQNY